MCMITCLIYRVHTMNFLPWNEDRKENIVLEDPVLKWLPEIDLEMPTQVLTYLSVLYFIGWVSIQSHMLMSQVCLSFIILILMRTLFIFVTPLRSYPCSIRACDPVQKIFTGQKTFCNDLMFSGHVGHIWLMTLWTGNFWIGLPSSLFIGLMMICSRVHYAVDVLTAFFVSFGCYRLSYLIVDEWTTLLSLMRKV